MIKLLHFLGGIFQHSRHFYTPRHHDRLYNSSSSWQVVHSMLEAQHILALKLHNNDFDQKVMLSEASRSDTFWWCKNLRNDPMPVLLPKATHSLYLDASQEGWGASHNTGYPRSQ